MNRSLVMKALSLALAVGLGSGCVNKRMMDFTYQELDSVKTAQREILRRLDALTQEMEMTRDERVRVQAENTLALRELREVVEALSYRIEGTEQLLTSRPMGVETTFRQPDREDPGTYYQPAAGDTAGLAEPDSSLLSPEPGDDDADRLFKASYMDLTLGNYDLAVQGFRNYLVRYPGAARKPGAHYYLAEAYFALSRFVEAIAEYQNVIRDYPQSRFIPAAYLKSGFCYQKLDERQLAEKAFRELISRYPRTEEAEHARAALNDMEG